MKADGQRHKREMERAREQPSSSERIQRHRSVQLHLQQHAHALARPHSTTTSKETHQDFRMTLEVSDFKRRRLTVEVRAGVAEREFESAVSKPIPVQGFPGPRPGGSLQQSHGAATPLQAIYESHESVQQPKTPNIQADHFNSLMGLPLHCKRYVYTNQSSKFQCQVQRVACRGRNLEHRGVGHPARRRLARAHRMPKREQWKRV